ncbi:Permease, cytosine/purine, uracil, thiamine, allantoin [Penicillium expansum]|nr:Permease, cytosine/purine, uracil, thiamine, allantoin [Penicillium expansum]KGO59131.1 Permease, cytosine/purine, uracil, thiamine, allantoin [Penicillium expansum]
MATRKENLAVAVKSKESFKAYLQVPGIIENSEEEGRFLWSNEDLLPVPPERRNWTYRTYSFLYFGWAMDNWTLGSTMIGIGLNWWQSILVILAGQLINSIFQAINSRCGSIYHISFPIVSRSVSGMVGSYFAVGTRSVMSVVYYALKLYIGSNFVRNMMRAVFGHAFSNIPNHLPISAGITTQGMIAFIVYWVIHIPIMFLRPDQMRWIFTMKIVSIFPAYIGLFIFCMVNTRGQLGSSLASAKETSSWQFSWFVMAAINASMGNNSLTTTNQPDFCRWSNKPWAPVIPQIIFNPLAVTIASTLGILATAAINNSWGLELWNQWDLLDEIMTRYWRPEVRFAVFLCALGQAALVMGTNVAGNIIPLGSDCSMLWPRYINTVRGQFIGLFLCYGYGMFFAAIVGPTIVEYYYFARGNIFVPELYHGSSDNHYYWFYKGWGLQAYAAYLIGIALPFTGFVGTLGASVPAVGVHMGDMGWLLSFFVSAFAYYVICSIFPTGVQRAIKDQGLGWEGNAKHLEGIIEALVGDDQSSESQNSAGGVRYVPKMSESEPLEKSVDA